MAQLLLGKPVRAALDEQTAARSAALREKNIVPTLAVVRLGENPSDLSYERGVMSRAASVGVEIKSVVLPENSEKTEVLSVIDRLNADASVHGVLLFRPLPKHLRADADEICNRLAPSKDVDGMTAASAAALYLGQGRGFAPCTAQACMELLHYYGVDCTGKNVAVIGRSAVIGKPVSLLLLGENATVTVCHTKTKNLPEICRNADILVSSAGCLGSLTKDYVNQRQIILDVSVNWDAAKGGISGDAVFEEVEPLVAAITPVPGGIGAVTTSVLLSHVTESAIEENR